MQGKNAYHMSINHMEIISSYLSVTHVFWNCLVIYFINILPGMQII